MIEDIEAGLELPEIKEAYKNIEVEFALFRRPEMRGAVMD